MRNVPQPIWDAWETGGPFLGDDAAPHGRVTVDKDWYLTATTATVGTYTKGPIRWWQRADNSQVETEVPNIRRILIDRSVDSDAASCEIEIFNTVMEANDGSDAEGTDLGKPGFYTASRGETPAGVARWGHQTNVWQDVLVPNALIRTYQGYGGKSKTIAQAKTDGNIVITGAWLVDDVHISSDGSMTLKCRDMSKLLLEQRLFPSLVPASQYPLDYYRYYNDIIEADLRMLGSWPRTQRTLSYASSSTDARYGYNGSVDGHLPSHACDNDLGTYALSYAYDNADEDTTLEWWEFNVSGGVINEVEVTPFIPPEGRIGQMYMYISVMVNGAWVDNNARLTIPYDPTGGVAVGAYEARIPYVVADFTASQGIAKKYSLGATYDAEKIRITLTRFKQAANSKFRGGLYEVGAWFREAPTAATAQVANIEGLRRRKPSVEIATRRGSGYVTSTDYDTSMGYYVVVGNGGVVWAYGEARVVPLVSGSLSMAKDMTLSDTGDGFWVVDEAGTVATYSWLSDIAHHGDLGSIGVTGRTNIVGIASTPNSGGYVIASSNGEVWGFGDVPATGGPASTTITAVAYHPSLHGYWLLEESGRVYNYHAAGHFGDAYGSYDMLGPNGLVPMVAMEPTPSGNGYWLVSAGGRVSAFGDAVHYGDVELNNADTVSEVTGIAATFDGKGYWLVQKNGRIQNFGNAEHFGDPLSGVEMLRQAGNYQDYVDIVKDLLLWSGFFLYETVASNAAPSVYGNLESTGAYAVEGPSAAFFDKQTVIDAINRIKEFVGYVFFLDEDGAVRFESPNWWQPGNFYEDGSYTTFVPELDETVQLISYSSSFTDRAVASEIVASSDVPDEDLNFTGTITARHTPQSSSLLRGMVKPYLFHQPLITTRSEMESFVELVAMHIFFQQRIGNVVIAANPALQINDQVRIYERNTADTYIHYVRGISSEMDLVSGRYVMSLQTHWLGDENDWAIDA